MSSSFSSEEAEEKASTSTRDAYHSEKDATSSPPAEFSGSIDQSTELGEGTSSNLAGKSSIKETIIDQSIISEEERQSNIEFFVGRGLKTPERYLKIRNYILNAWLKSKPKFVSKTSVRPGLKDCGDVNAIGRVHLYLESIGAINIGKDSVKKEKRPVKRKSLDETTKKSSNSIKRKGKSEDGDYRRGRENLNGTKENSVEPTGGSYDPFRLVPPHHYTSRNPAPFRVSVSTNVMLLMDFHAHLAHTEIIGLLGGHFFSDRELMEVTYVYPCKSSSTGFQCEMDPASEVAAREVFAEKGLEFVGWYHSHPTFDPQPSIRDIENQTQYQEMWRREDGVEPFIGVIVTPYDIEHDSNVSRFQFWMSGTNYDLSGQFRTPYSCQHSFLQNENLPEEIFSQMTGLVKEYHNYDQRVNMTESYRKDEVVSRLDKLIESLSSHITVSSKAAETFISRVRELMNTEFRPNKNEEESQLEIDAPVGKESILS
ncbi:hypothetical protein C1645_743937 [Glomus cerebriforme]|uniref:Uncharacterized protein n=1 Tax=Glomus cerebriforme TaxID=658196 RepID=A0A397S9Q3_9GLOM|nr:hypothetical protein C1645_743937 [Glomus cerebriforme]